MFVYKITNIINGKLYIGQTIRPVEDRFKRHINDAINNTLDTHFARAIRKYGENSFIIEIIDTATTQEELTQKELYWIRKYNTIKMGYNEVDSIFKSGGNTYQSKTKDELNTIKEKIRKTKIGNKNPNSKSVKCKNIKTGEELHFSSEKECQLFFQEKIHRFITTRVTKKTFSPYKDIWLIAYINEDYYYEPKHKCGRMVEIEDISINKTYKFYSIRQASKIMKIPREKILDKSLVDNKYKITILN